MEQVQQHLRSTSNSITAASFFIGELPSRIKMYYGIHFWQCASLYSFTV